MSKRRKALVTGGTGFIGRYLVRGLAAKGWQVRLLVRTTSDIGNLGDIANVELVEGDILEPQSLEGIADGVTSVFHLAAAGHVSAMSEEAYEEFFKINVGGLENVMRACANRGVEKFVHFSSTAAMGLIRKELVSETDEPEPRTPYQKSKLASERRALELGAELGLPTVVLRPCMVYGVGGFGEFEKMARLMRKGAFPRVGRGRNLTPLVHVRDVVEGALLAAEGGRGGEIYLLTSARSPGLSEIRVWVMRGWGSWAPYPYIPRLAMLAIALFFENFAKLSGGTPMATRQNIANTIFDREFSIAKASKDFGYEPKVTFEDGIRETVAWFKENG